MLLFSAWAPKANSFASRYQVLGQLCLVAAIVYIQRSAISVPAKDIARDLSFDNFTLQMGRIQTAWYLGYALFQLPSGWLADRFGSRITLTAFCLLWSVMTGLAGFAADFWSLLLFWGLMGATQAGVFPCATKAIGQVFPDNERARASGLLACGMAIGGAIAPLITAWGLGSLNSPASQMGLESWRLLLGIYAIPGILWAIFFLLTTSASALPKTERADTQIPKLPWSRLFQSPSVVLLCAQQFLRAMAMVFFLTWFPVFLQETRGVTPLESGVLTTYASLGGVVGTLLGGFASDWIFQATGNRRLSRQGIAVIGMSLSAVLILGSYFAAATSLSIALISLAAFCATFGGVSGYTVAIEFGGRHVATVFSAMNMCGNFGAALFPITAAWLVEFSGNWNLLIFLFAGIMTVDAVCWALLNPRGTLMGDSDESR